MTGELLRQSAFASGFDAGRARAEAEVQRLTAENAAMRAVVEAARTFFRRDGSRWFDRPGCALLGVTGARQCTCGGHALGRALAALAHLDARTATPEGMQSEPPSQPPQPEQDT